MVVSCCAYGCSNCFGERNKDLGFIDFQLFPGLEERNGSAQLESPRFEIFETILHQVSLQQAIASARILLCAVAIKSFYIDIESMLFCTVLP